MHTTLYLFLAVCLAACASTSGSSSTTSDGTRRWSGTLRQTPQRTGALAPTSTQNATGSVFLTGRADSPERFQVRLVVSAPGNASSSLRWAILPGSCGTSAFPVTGYETFPPVDIGSNGRGELSRQLALSLDSGENYHVNVYRGQGTQLSDVLTCGNLREGN